MPARVNNTQYVTPMKHLVRHTACGKIILLGEHFVVYGCPAVAVPLTARGTTVELLRDPAGGVDRLESDAPGADLDLANELLRAAIKAVGLPADKGLVARVSSTLPVGYGLGSSASLAVALSGALSELAAADRSTDEIRRLAHHLERVTHGTPSGIDDNVVSRRVPVRFRKGEGARSLVPAGDLCLLLASSGSPGSTREAVASVRGIREADPERFDSLVVRAAALVEQGVTALETGDVVALGLLMDYSHHLLLELDVSTPRIEALVRAARLAGALGAKLTGSGKGGFIVALADPDGEADVARSLEAAGSPLVIRPGETP